MSSKLDFVEYVCEQLDGVGEVTFRKMFGEFGLYLNGKIFALICDDRLYIKITEAGKKLMPDYTEAPPYKGAKPYFLIEDIENKALLCKLARITYEELPEPKPKRPHRY